MNAKVVVLQHVAREGPARLAAAAARAGLDVFVVRLDEGAPVPEVDPKDVLVVMGGPMGVADIGAPATPFLAAEVELLKTRIARDAPTVGICLGAQLLAFAAGARVYPNVTKAGSESRPLIELGWSPVRFVDEPTEAVLTGLPAEAMMLHWHGDTFDLPTGAVLLGSTPSCAHQAFRLRTRLFGFQFHAEADASTVGRWVQEDAAYVARARGPGGADAVRAETAALTKRDRALCDLLLDNVFAVFASAQGR